MQRDYNGYNYHTFSAKTSFSLIGILKSSQKKLAITLFYCLGQETWLGDWWKLICINQSSINNFFHVGKFKRF